MRQIEYKDSIESDGEGQTEPVLLTARFYDEDKNLVTPELPMHLIVVPPQGDAEKIGSVSPKETGVFKHKYVGEGTGRGEYYYEFRAADGGTAEGRFRAQ